jgi:hypothetical protein
MHVPSALQQRQYCKFVMKEDFLKGVALSYLRAPFKPMNSVGIPAYQLEYSYFLYPTAAL